MQQPIVEECVAIRGNFKCYVCEKLLTNESTLHEYSLLEQKTYVWCSKLHRHMGAMFILSKYMSAWNFDILTAIIAIVCIIFYTIYGGSLAAAIINVIGAVLSMASRVYYYYYLWYTQRAKLRTQEFLLYDVESNLGVNPFASV